MGFFAYTPPPETTVPTFTSLISDIVLYSYTAALKYEAQVRSDPGMTGTTQDKFAVTKAPEKRPMGTKSNVEFPLPTHLAQPKVPIIYPSSDSLSDATCNKASSDEVRVKAHWA